MKVKKILNNNVIVTQNEKGKEVIVMGRGLAFGLRIDENINQSKVDKVFTLSSSLETSRFKEVVELVPEEYFEMTEGFIDYAKVQLGKKLQNSIYITLTDHINTMIERGKEGAYIKNAMLWDIKRLYREEFQVGQEIVEKINKLFKTEFDNNEAVNIAMHFVNAQTELEFSTTANITKIMTQIMNIVKYNFLITYNEDSLSYYRFVVHLRAFAQRLFTGTTYQDSDDNELLQHIKNKYTKSFHCAQLIQQHVFDSYEYTLEGEELLYLIIHIEKVVKDSKRV